LSSAGTKISAAAARLRLHCRHSAEAAFVEPLLYAVNNPHLRAVPNSDVKSDAGPGALPSESTMWWVMR
jgi:hypothetical protein